MASSCTRCCGGLGVYVTIIYLFSSTQFLFKLRHWFPHLEEVKQVILLRVCFPRKIFISEIPTSMWTHAQITASHSTHTCIPKSVCVYHKIRVENKERHQNSWNFTPLWTRSGVTIECVCTCLLLTLLLMTVWILSLPHIRRDFCA